MSINNQQQKVQKIDEWHVCCFAGNFFRTQYFAEFCDLWPKCKELLDWKTKFLLETPKAVQSTHSPRSNLANLVLFSVNEPANMCSALFDVLEILRTNWVNSELIHYAIQRHRSLRNCLIPSKYGTRANLEDKQHNEWKFYTFWNFIDVLLWVF